MFKQICVTHRGLCKGDFLDKIACIAKTHPDAIILREKDLDEGDYMALAQKVIAICQRHEVECILHSFTNCAIALSHKRIHMPLPALRALSQQKKDAFNVLGCSCHSVQEALEAEQLGATYIIVGHIYPTDCKKGLAPRGLSLLGDVCQVVHIPVYAIGGIDPSKYSAVKAAGASGACRMSAYFK